MRSKLITLFVCLLLLTGFTFAQEFRATISGHVYDSSNAAVPGAKVQAINVATSETTTATTDSSGSYTIPFLRPGIYKVTVTAQGFKQYNEENIQLQVGKVAGIDAHLEVGAVSESINVTAEAAMLETQTASRGGVVTTQQITEIPLNARNPFMLGAMMPGVTFRGAAIWQRPFDNGAIAEWSVNGSRNSSTEFMLDGASNNGQMGNNNIAYVPIVDAVQEFNMQMNSYNAEYGHTGGGVMNVMLKSGTNDFHVTGWEFMRRTPLDANTFQNNAIPASATNPTGGAKRATHYLDQYGFQLEGPVYIPKILKKDAPVKLFYMGSFENYREGTPTPLTLSYPEAEMRQGDFSKVYDAANKPVTIYNPFDYTLVNGDPVRNPFPGNKIPQSMINPVAANVAKFMPKPNQPTPPGQHYANQNLVYPDYFAKDKFYNLILKFDWNFGDKHRAFFRHASNDRTEDRNDNGVWEGPGQSGQQPFQRINDAYVADWVGTVSPTFILNARASYNRFIEQGWGRGNEGFDLKSLGLPASLVSQMPGPQYFGRWEFHNGYSPLGRYQDINKTNTYTLAANATKIWNSHTMKMGFETRQINYLLQNSGNIFYAQGQTNFTQRLYNQGESTSGDGFASFLLGVPNNITTNYPLYPWWRNYYSAPFFQDDWKVSRRLTVNMGFRLDFNTPAHEKWNRQNGPFDPTAASAISKQIPADMIAMYPQLANLKGSMTWAGVNGMGTTVAKLSKWNWQPRAGFAYQLSEKLVMRGGIGRYYSNPNNDIQKTNGFSTSTSATNSNDGGRTPIANVLSNPFPMGINFPVGSSQGSLAWAGRDFSWFDSNFRTPYVWQFSYGFQYQVNKASTLEVTYVGSRGKDMTHEKAFNIPSIDVRKKCLLQEGGSPIFCDSQVPNPFKGVDAFKGTSWYTANTLSWFQMQRPFPQFSGNMTQQGRNDSWMKYNSAQVTYNMRFRGGLNLLGNYTWSKSMEAWGYNDPYSNNLQSGLYYNDRPHIFKLTTVYDLPFGKGKKFGSSTTGFTNKLISGWEFTTFYTNSSGEPADNPDGNVIQLKDPRTPGGGWDGTTDWKAHQVRGWNPCVMRQLNDGSMAPTSTSIAKGCGTDMANYAWLWTAGYAPRNTPYRSGQIRKHHAFTMDASINKMTNITERLKLQFRAEAFNVMNHNYYGRDVFNKDPNNPNFGTVFPGTVSTQNMLPRQIQIGFKVLW